MSLQHRQIILNNLLVNYYQDLTDSNKPVLLFLHGWRSEAAIWDNIIKKLSGDYNIYALDLPGFGASQTPQKAFYLQDYADIVDAFIKKFHLKNISLVGHSFGGRTVIKLTSNNPDYLNKIILVDSAGIRQNSSQRALKKVAAKILKPIFKLPFLQNARQIIYKKLGALDYLATPQLQTTFVNIINEDLTPLLNKIVKSTLLIWGKEDKDTPLAQAKIMEQSVPSSKLVVLESAGHFSFLDKPDEFVKNLRIFLK